MRSTSFAAVILTLFMLLLVLGAAFIFLFQGRQTLAVQRAELATSVVSLEAEVEANSLAIQRVEATRLATGEELATAVAEKVLLEGQLVASDQQIDTLTATVEALTTIIATVDGPLPTPMPTVKPTAGPPPQVEIVFPITGTAVTVGTPLQIVFFADDPAGLTTITLTINDEIFQTYEPEGLTAYTARETWLPEEAGILEISLSAVNVNGQASNPTTLALIITAAQPEPANGTSRRLGR
jgi:hypothetical protein